MDKEPKKKIEFSKLIVIVLLVFALVWVTWSYLLADAGMDPNTEVTSTVVEAVIGVSVVYFLYQFGLKSSRNKHGIAEDGVPYRLHQKYKDVFNGGSKNDE